MPISIILDESCASLFDQVRPLGPTFVFTRKGGFRTLPSLAVEELREALLARSFSGPYVLVGASFAGLTALLFAYRFPAEVAGLVLVDSSHPHQSTMAAAALPADLPSSPEIVAFRHFVAGFGPDWEESCRLFADLGSLGSIPIIALAAGRPPMPDSLPPAVRERLTAGWHALQTDHARRSTRGVMRVVDGCGHAIATERPDVAIAAIAELVPTFS